MLWRLPPTLVTVESKLRQRKEIFEYRALNSILPNNLVLEDEQWSSEVDEGID